MALNDYTPTTDFSQDETNQVSGRSTVRTSNLDAEFDNLKLSIDSIITRLQSVTRDDAALTDGVVTYESLSAEVVALLGSAGYTPRGAWITATSYAQKDVVKNGTGTYVCVTAHTSGTFATDLAAVKWLTLWDSSAFAASNISFTPAGGISAINVQNAIVEVEAEAPKLANNGSDFTAATFRSNIAVPSKTEVQNQTHSYAADVGTADALSVTLTPAPSITNGTRVHVKKGANASTSPAPTLEVNGSTKTIFKQGGLALAVGDMPANSHLDFEYDSTYSGGSGGWDLINPVASSTGSSSTFSLSGVLTPAQITANQNDYSPTGMSAASTLRLSSDAARAITGLAGGTTGRIIVIHNVGSYGITLSDESGSSSAANRFAMTTDLTLMADQSVTLQYDATSQRWRILNGFITNMKFGQCRLTKSGANLLLSPCDGNLLTIDGIAYEIPDAGVTLGGSVAADGFYYIYAYMSAGVMTLEASTTARAASTKAGNKGMQIKSGDDSRTLVGAAYNQTDAWTDTFNSRLVLSWFNRRDITGRAWLTTNRTVAAFGPQEIHTEARVYFICWADEAVHAHANGTASNSNAFQTTDMCIGIDGVSVIGGISKQANTTAASVNSLAATTQAPAGQLTEAALHYLVLAGGATANTATYYGGADNAVRCEINFRTRG